MEVKNRAYDIALAMTATTPSSSMRRATFASSDRTVASTS